MIRIFYLFLFSFLLVGNNLIAEKSYSAIKARAYLIYDMQKDKILFEKSKDKPFPAASMTKLFTAIAAREVLDDKRVITINNSAIVDNPIESKAGLQAKESYTLRMLLYALLIPSGNDAAYAIAEGVSGSKTKFVEMMNNWKQKYNLERSFFDDAAGLSPHTKIPPADLLKALLLIHQDPLLRDIMSRKEFILKSEEGREIPVKSRTKVFKYAGFTINGKTGTTRAAGQCFAGYLSSNKRDYIIVIMGSSNSFREVKKGIDMIIKVEQGIKEKH